MRRSLATATMSAALALCILSVGCTLPAEAIQRSMEAASPKVVAAGQALEPTVRALEPTVDPNGTVPSTVSPPLATDEQVEQMFDAAELLTIRVYDRVSPSVVFITSRVMTMGYFGMYPSEGTGSGFVIDKQGHIVTNYHVIEGAQTVEVTLLDDTVAEAEVIGVDPPNDLAVIRVDVDEGKLFPVDMTFRGELRVGQRAIAIGNPFGLNWTLTTGVISSLGRPLQVSDDQVIWDVVQTDAAINPGNSGGPLLNSSGKLIGVNAAIRAGAENIGFAIPIQTVHRVVPELIENGRYPRPGLGISGIGVFPELARRLELPVEQGILITRVFVDTPANRAGIRGGSREVSYGNFRLIIGGDILVGIDGSPIENNTALREFLETKTRVGHEVEVTFYRGGELMTVMLVLAEIE